MLVSASLSLDHILLWGWVWSYQGPAAGHSPDKCVSMVGAGDMKGTTQNTAGPISLSEVLLIVSLTQVKELQYGVSNGRSLVRINIDSKCKLSEGWVTYISPPPGIYLWGLSVRSIHTNDQEQEDGELFWTVVISPTFPSLCPCLARSKTKQAELDNIYLSQPSL